MSLASANIETEWIILADYAEVINGKVYMTGGGWNNLTLQQLPAEHAFGVAVAFSIPWEACNERHPIKILIVGPDGEQLANVEGEVEVGRPPGILVGSAQRVPLAFNARAEFAALGTFVIKTYVHDELSKEARFNVLEGRPGLANEWGQKKRAGEHP
jgi:hypothetical protein